MKAKLKQLSVTLDGDNPKLTLSFDHADAIAVQNFLNEYRLGVDYMVHITPIEKQKRSLSANALLWTIAGKIAEKIRYATKDDIYKRIIEEVGAYVCITIKAEAYESFVAFWEARGTGWFTNLLSPRDFEMLDLICYYGSSTYTPTEMSRCIDHAVEMAQDLGVEILPHSEIEKIKKEWKQPLKTTAETPQTIQKQMMEYNQKQEKTEIGNEMD